MDTQTKLILVFVVLGAIGGLMFWRGWHNENLRNRNHFLGRRY